MFNILKNSRIHSQSRPMSSREVLIFLRISPGIGVSGYLVPMGTAGYRVPRKFQMFGTAGLLVPRKFQKMKTAEYRVPAIKTFLSIDGYRVSSRKNFWVPIGTGYGQIFNDVNPGLVTMKCVHSNNFQAFKFQIARLRVRL